MRYSLSDFARELELAKDRIATLRDTVTEQSEEIDTLRQQLVDRDAEIERLRTRDEHSDECSLGAVVGNMVISCDCGVAELLLTALRDRETEGSP
jgi:predicted RNase H-like nuclease (RuvC/YqgF family)